MSKSPPVNAAAPAPERLIFESGSPGRSAFFWDEDEPPLTPLPEVLVRSEIAGFPELGELEAIRHFTRLSQQNFGIESQFYPLGSCTMKYNPKVNEAVARLAGFSQVHPLAPSGFLEGALRLLFELERMLAEIAGMDAVSLQPSAGAQGELTGLMMIRAFLKDRGNPRKKIIVPDTAHGTNPASSTLCGYDVVQISSNEHGVIDPARLAAALDEEVAAGAVSAFAATTSSAASPSSDSSAVAVSATASWAGASAPRATVPSKLILVVRAPPRACPALFTTAVSTRKVFPAGGSTTTRESSTGRTCWSVMASSPP